MFRSRKTKTEFLTVGFEKNWANASAEIERLGQRLDAVRLARKSAKRNSWAKKHWTQTEQIILRKWKATIRLKDVGLKQVGVKNDLPDVDYSWWEPSYEIAMRFPIIDAISNYITDRFGLSSGSLDRAWEMAREEKLQKARQGLA